MPRNWEMELTKKLLINKAISLSNLNITRRKTKLKFKCFCGTIYEKTARMILDSTGFFCKFHTSINGAKKRGNKINWSNLLKTIEKRDNAKILTNTDNIVNGNIKIIFLCFCGKETHKSCNNITRGGGLFCKKHLIENKILKHKKTIKQKYNVENISQIENVKEKKKETCLKKWGYETNLSHPDIKEQIKKTNIEKYGVSNLFNSRKIQDKIKKTNLEKYGVSNPMQNKEIFEKSLKSGTKRKPYIFDTGDLVIVQGYEPLALELLEKQGYVFEDIKIEPFKIQYELNNKKHYYFPDIYIPKENLIIEVKSTWTYKLHLEKNLKKREYCEKQKYNFEFWIFDKKGKLTII